MKTTKIKPTSLLPVDKVEVLVMTRRSLASESSKHSAKEIAGKLILDLFEDAADIGFSRIVLRTEEDKPGDSRYFILKVKN
jgi:hypothetical protein